MTDFHKQLLKGIAIGLSAFLIGLWVGNITATNKVDRQIAQEKLAMQKFLSWGPK